MESNDIAILDKETMCEQTVRIVRKGTIYSTVVGVDHVKGQYHDRGKQWDTMTGRLSKLK